MIYLDLFNKIVTDLSLDEFNFQSMTDQRKGWPSYFLDISGDVPLDLVRQEPGYILPGLPGRLPDNLRADPCRAVSPPASPVYIAPM